MANLLAGARLELRAVEQLEIAGVRLRLSEMSMPTAWEQVEEWERGGVPAEALRYLTGNEMPTGNLTVNRTFYPGDPTPTDDDPDLCRGLAAALLREAQEQGVYIPNSAFVLALPTDYPLRAWGVSGLRVWAYPDGLLVATVDDEGQIGASFGWRPGEALSGWAVSEQSEPLLTTMLAALWRDLCVAGEDAVPERRRSGQETGRWRRKPSRRAGKRAASGRTLPSGRSGRLRGRRQWGNDVEREAIQRQSHGVRGHLRRLQRGWQAGNRARSLALEFGVAALCCIWRSMFCGITCCKSDKVV
jgi:hypothetical protein